MSSGRPAIDRVHRVAVPDHELVGILAAGDHLLAEVGVAQVGEADVVHLEVAATGGVERVDLGAVGGDEVVPELVEVGVHVAVDHLRTAHQVRHARPRDRDLRDRLRRRIGEEREVVDEDRLVEVDLADDDRDRRALTLAREVLRSLALGGADPAERGEEVEVPPVATELAVGDGWQADRLLLGHHFRDRFVLDRAQLLGAAACPRATRRGHRGAAPAAASCRPCRRDGGT